MTKINEILTLDLQEDIKNVIDLEDHSELEIQQEIESYIVTEGIGGHLYHFTNQFTSNIKETGVWLSGFYGSGKSYFGKMLGYIIDNPIINGTPARERFIPRLKGVTDESLIENAIRNLESINSRVIFLDVAKQNTDRGLAFTLFVNLLKNLGFRDDLYGYMEFDLFIDGKLDEFKSIVKSNEGQEWKQLKTSNRKVAKVMRKVFTDMGYSEADYADTQKVYRSAIEDFSASKFRAELEKYLNCRSEETLVFVFDEASEAISQQKFTLLDLEGISEALSSISNKVWTIAIAQEKLDDVINNANVNRSQLTKVTDRFKTKLHLESTEVDVIIRSRLLQKTKKGHQQLVNYHKKNEGLVSDVTNLKSSFPTKTTDAHDFAIYYPFHKYQLNILQKFLFSSNALVATQIAVRGMIITTFDVLRKQMRGKELHCFTPGHSICTEAQTAPPIGLVNKYDTAKKILNEHGPAIDGENLLKTIHFLVDSDVVSPTVENITKSYISEIASYYDVKPHIENALGLLLEAKVLLLSNNNYKATKFKLTSFKSITTTLSATQKNQAVQLLMGLDIEIHTGRNVDWNTNDFDLADGIRYMADHFIGVLSTLNETVDGFETLFSGVADQKQILLSFTGKITEKNYIEKVEYLLNNSDPFEKAIQSILKAKKFIKKNFSKVKEFKHFIEEVTSEIKKADRKDAAIQEAGEAFNRLYEQDMVKNFSDLQKQVQIVKDNYYKLIKNAAAGMSHAYQLIGGQVDAALRTLKGYPAELNRQNQKKLDDLKRYCSDRIVKEPVLAYSISCKNCGYSLSDILNYTELAPTKENQLVGIQNGFITALTPPNPDDDGDSEKVKPSKTPIKVTLSLDSTAMTIGEYKSILSSQLQKLVGLNDSDGIELKIETTGKQP